jgi:hypothetical protein
MNTWRVLYQSTRADFLERTRRYSFFVTLAIAIFCAYAYIPPAEADGVTFSLGGYRGIYNSAWIGAIIAVLCSALLSIPGFYLVKNAIERDRETGVGQILATTPLTRFQYMLGKFFSNFVFLTVMAGVVMGSGVVMQFIRGESSSFQVWDYFSPFLVTTLPVLTLVAGIALLFEAVPFMRGGFGNVVYLFIYLGAVMASVMPATTGTGYRSLNEPFGLTALAADMSRDVKEVYPAYDGGLVVGYTGVRGEIQTFEWDGIEWTAPILLQRMFWVCVSFLAAGVAALVFTRFDPSSETGKRKVKKGHTNKPVAEDGDFITEKSSSVSIPAAEVSLTPVTHRRVGGFGLFVRLLIAEGKLMMHSVPWWWLLVALGLVVAGFFNGEPGAGKTVQLLAWLWPILIWSGMGCREVRSRTNEIVFSAEHPIGRQLPVTWLAGFLLALAMASGILFQALLAGAWAEVGALLAGAIFIPSLSLAFGSLTGGSKLFEVVYLILWYAGPANQIPALDFTGSTPQAIAQGTPFYFLAVSVVLLLISVAGRQRQIRTV